MMKKMAWKVGLRKKNCKDDFFFLKKNENYYFDVIDVPKKYWIADPFVITENDEDYLFFEAFDRYKNKGVIAYCKIENHLTSKLKVVIEEPYHLSYPYLFKKNNKIYMIPESSGNKTIQLYEAIEFPNKWEKKSILLYNLNAVDTVIFEEKGKEYLITSIINNKNFCDVENRMYRINENFTIDEKFDSLKSGEYGTRNGGKIFKIDNKHIRVGQDCKNGKYGNGIVMWEINSIFPYNEKEILNIDAKYIKNHINVNLTPINGIHTYNFNDKYEVIDVLTEEDVMTFHIVIAFCCRTFRFIKRRLFRLLKYSKLI